MLIRFEEFEVNSRSGDLLRRRKRIRLQNQPFQVLMLLLENRGEVVTRDELRAKVWQPNTFVDFDLGLNKAIHALRRALRDSTNKPRFIETLPRRGYRFIAPIQIDGNTASNIAHPDLAEPQRGSRIESVAVLPLENLSGDPEQEYFADGTTAELIAALAKIGSIRVISRTSVMTFKGIRQSLPAIARQLRADAIVEGSVARSRQTVRITAQLICAAEDKLLWSGTFERELRDMLKLQGEIARSIADQIQGLVEPRNLWRSRARRIDPRAYEACLKGNFFRNKMTPADLRKSVELFNLALELDPDYARAYGELSQSYFFCGVFGVESAEEMFARARANAERAVALDENLAIAHNSLAAIHIFHDWDWARAEIEVRRAVELSPGDPVGYAHFADYMSIRGRHGEAIEEFRTVLELDPISPVYLAHFALLLYRARRYDDSIAQCRKALDIDPHYPNALWFLALSLEQKGELSEAVATLEKAVQISDAPHYRALLGRSYALSGRRTDAQAILHELQALAQQRYISPFDIAVLYLGLGDTDSAFDRLEEAYHQRVFRLIELTLPMFDSLRRDQHWHDIVCRIGLAVNC
jgi:TolB-like protein/Flp pilus assembly protein TadD